MAHVAMWYVFGPSRDYKGSVRRCCFKLYMRSFDQGSCSHRVYTWALTGILSLDLTWVSLYMSCTVVVHTALLGDSIDRS